MNTDKIISDVCEFHDITKEDLLGKPGQETIVWAKRCYAFILFYHSELSISEISQSIQRSITTTYRYIHWYQDIYVANKEVRSFVNSIIYYNS